MYIVVSVKCDWFAKFDASFNVLMKKRCLFLEACDIFPKYLFLHVGFYNTL